MDLLIENSGSIIMITPMTKEGREWVKNNLITEEWQRLGLSIAVDIICIENIIRGIQKGGLTFSRTI